MEINHERVKLYCSQKGISLGQALKASEVSSNAYYSLVRKDSVLPKSITCLAETLGVPVSELLFDRDKIALDHARLMQEVEEVAELTGVRDSDLVKHTLLLLKEEPIDRLKRGLELGRLGCH